MIGGHSGREEEKRGEEWPDSTLGGTTSSFILNVWHFDFARAQRWTWTDSMIGSNSGREKETGGEE